MTAWLAGVALLAAAAWLRGAEYDEQYTLLLTAGVPRPAWPDGPFPAGLVQAAQTGHAGLLAIAHDLRATDVHPPLYFWAVSLWRGLLGPDLLAARSLSVLCGAVSLALVGRIAWVIREGDGSAGPDGMPSPASAMLMTALCYGFAYTNAIARGFAPAETATLVGVLLLLRRRPGWAGLAFGAACACNYLAVFPAIAACVVARAWRALPGAMPFLVLDGWCFLAQHGARSGQFPPFALLPSAIRLAGYETASMFGGLPLYWDGPGRVVASTVVGLASLAVPMQILMQWCSPPARPGFSVQLLLLATALAPACGLLALGVVFNNTPIELRYLCFGLPFLALLASGPRLGRGAIMLVQGAGIAGLLLAPRTMQPARDAARDAAMFADDALALVPAGNDGVGIVGAFGIEAPPGLMLRLVRPDQQIVIPHAYRRVILVLLGQDQDSRATLPAMQAALAGPDWRRIANGANLEVYERTPAGG